MRSIEKTLEQLRYETGDTLLAIARLVQFQEANIRQIRIDMSKSKPGSSGRLQFLKLLGHETRKHAELLADLGYYPKQIGTSSQSYTFRSMVTIGGASSVERVPETLEVSLGVRYSPSP